MALKVPKLHIVGSSVVFYGVIIMYFPIFLFCCLGIPRYSVLASIKDRTQGFMGL